jgi:hypothetical protein
MTPKVQRTDEHLIITGEGILRDVKPFALFIRKGKRAVLHSEVIMKWNRRTQRMEACQNKYQQDTLEGNFHHPNENAAQLYKIDLAKDEFKLNNKPGGRQVLPNGITIEF